MNSHRLLLLKITLALVLVPLLSIPNTGHQSITPVVQAQDAGGGGGVADPDALQPGNDLWPTINNLINLVRSYMIPLAILIIIYAGILYETSAMNPALQGTAKTILWTTITGLIFLILYPTIVGILSDNGLIPSTEIDSTTGGVVTPTPTPR